ncbi:MAG: hypothetical protein CMM78_02695 [Rhodospirillaceae bacterium]|nr:hypothetical protein [Rhodospirillales bacterium]MAX47093.1 hypothetical protein [Rhodospirillaceae bacterium]
MEVYSKSGRHLGAIDGVTGEWTDRADTIKDGKVSENEIETGKTTSGSA